MWILALLFLLPFAWMISTSLKPDVEAFRIPMQWIPDEPRWENYTEVLFGESSILIPRSGTRCSSRRCACSAS